MERYQPLSLTAQTAYAQLLDSAQALDLTRSVADLNGSFASKTVKGRRYWYFQFTELSGRLRKVVTPTRLNRWRVRPSRSVACRC